jgi:hypothetical protein
MDLMEKKGGTPQNEISQRAGVSLTRPERTFLDAMTDPLSTSDLDDLVNMGRACGLRIKDVEYIVEWVRNHGAHLLTCEKAHLNAEQGANVFRNPIVRRIINAANRKKPHSVPLCINGHHHRDNLRILDGVCYWDLNSTSYDWIDTPHSLYPAELYEQHRLVGNTVVYSDLLYAVVELNGTTVRIRGKESSMLYGISRQHTDNPVYDAMGRPVSPTIQSVEITL